MYSNGEPRNSYRRTCSGFWDRRDEKRWKVLSSSDSKASFRSAWAAAEEPAAVSSAGSNVTFSGIVGVDGRESVSYSASR